jgi:hypothetical protein
MGQHIEKETLRIAKTLQLENNNKHKNMKTPIKVTLQQNYFKFSNKI